MASRSWIEGALVAVAIALAAAPAHAEDADALLKQGVELRRAGRDAEALAAFQRAYAEKPSAHARAQIALAESALSLWVDAERDLAAAMAERDDPWIKENREALERAAHIVAARLAWVTALAPEAVSARAELYVNGQRAGAWPATTRLRLVAGRVAFEVRAPGREPWSRVVEVPPETDSTVTLAIGAPRAAAAPAGAPSPAPTDRPETTSNTQRTLGWFALGVGGVGLGVGAAFGVKALSLEQDRDAACPGGIDHCTQAGVDADRSGRSAALASTIAAGVGLGAAIVGLYLVLTAPASPRDRAAALRVSPTWMGVAVDGAFF